MAAGQPQRNYDPYSNTYNSGWKDHPNLSYGNPQSNQPMTQNCQSFQQFKQPYPPRQQQGQSFNSGNKTIPVGGKIPSQMVVNPREHVSAILLRNGKEVEIPKATPTSLEKEKEKDVIEEKSVPTTMAYLSALVKPMKDEHNHELYETFRKCEKHTRCEKINVGKNVSAIIQRKLLTKWKNSGMFTISCTIGNTRFEKAMLDLGVSINVMPYSVYSSLKLGPLNETGVIIQLADKINAYPKGVVEDVLMNINDLEVLESNEKNAVKVVIVQHIKEVDQKLPLNSGLAGSHCSIECFSKVTKVK
ncbi:uncharacterized protein LOC111389637 [Olea europaea var. sylvestris]|uniref:uncharacterized protein LOC111389637 n=1 Tax=Olea europaea var. sylvestris TaxID=158386 RepID=UPI000C1CF196|nr:uncharacterized protein LOC111389637 [Olea europaea var. sylvestris]